MLPVKAKNRIAGRKQHEPRDHARDHGLAGLVTFRLPGEEAQVDFFRQRLSDDAAKYPEGY